MIFSRVISSDSRIAIPSRSASLRRERTRFFEKGFMDGRAF
jgi:hypothetical protein